MGRDKVDLFARIRDDNRQLGLGVRALARKHGVHRRMVREALASPVPAPRKMPARQSPVLDAAAGLIDAMLREDFLQVAVEVGWEPFRDRQVAAVDFAAAADAVQGVLPCSDGERQVLLVAASIAGGIPVDLREAALCMDAVNAARAARAICHAAGCRVQVVTETCR